MTDNTFFVASVVALLGEHGGAWSGTAGALLTLLPGAAADPTRLAVRLSAAGGDLSAAGVVAGRRRRAGTGTRMLTLRVVEATVSTDEHGEAAEAAGQLAQTAQLASGVLPKKPLRGDERSLQGGR